MSPPQDDDPRTTRDLAARPEETLEADAVLSEDATLTTTDDSPTNPEEAKLEEHRMSLLEHLSELRVRLRNASLAFIASMLVAFFFVQRFFEVLTRPVRIGMIKAGFKPILNVKGVTEPFWVYMKLAIVAGVLIASPLVFWELWKFIAPGLYRKEKKIAAGVTISTALCFIGGAVFGYFVLCQPAAYYMMSLLKTSDLKTPVEFGLAPQLMMDDVADFLMMTLAGCGVAFELPVVVALLGSLGIVTTKSLWKFNKYALVLATVLGAVLTPSTDPFTQMLLAGPLFALYEISILMVWIMERARKKKDIEEGLEDELADDDVSADS